MIAPLFYWEKAFLKKSGTKKEGTVSPRVQSLMSFLTTMSRSDEAVVVGIKRFRQSNHILLL